MVKGSKHPQPNKDAMAPHLRRKTELPPLPPQNVIWYTAGFFDGEGSIHHSKRKRDGGPTFHCSVSQSEVNDGGRVLHWLAARWGIGTITRRPTKPGYADAFVWRFASYGAVVHFLDAIRPMLIVKQAQAEELLKLLAEWPTNPPPPMAQLICAYCNARFERRQTKTRPGGGPRFCCREHVIKARTGVPRHQKAVVCALCGLTVHRPQSHLRTTTGRYFCSLEHAYEYRRRNPEETLFGHARHPAVIIPCAFCGEPTRQRPSRVESNKTGNFFCSRDHFARWRGGEPLPNE